MSIDRAEKKLREAQFFLNRMREKHAMAFGDKEPIDFYLSAFLNAAKTVDYQLSRAMGQGKAYERWRDAWENGLPDAANAALHKFFADDRDLEVHDAGSQRTAGTTEVPMHNSEYSDASGTLQVSAAICTPYPAATLQKPRYTFTIDGVEREAVEACAAYLELVKQKVAKLRASLIPSSAVNQPGSSKSKTSSMPDRIISRKADGCVFEVASVPIGTSPFAYGAQIAEMDRRLGRPVATYEVLSPFGEIFVTAASVDRWRQLEHDHS